MVSVLSAIAFYLTCVPSPWHGCLGRTVSHPRRLRSWVATSQFGTMFFVQAILEANINKEDDG